MLDLHTHILPKLDDGSRSMKQSLAMLMKEAWHDVDTVVLTPHFYANRESPERFLKRRDAAADQLMQAAGAADGLPEIRIGAEVAYFTGISRAEGIERLCIDGTRALLIEMPFCRWSQSVLEELDFLLESRGIRPIIAHIERYMQYQPLGTVKRLCEAGIWIQANTSFFTKWHTSFLAMRMLRKHRIHFIGSDCHDMKKRPPNMGAAISSIEIRIGLSAISHLAYMEQLLLEGG